MRHGEQRDASPAEIATILRAVMGFPPDQAMPGELAATLGRTLPAVVRDIDAAGWIAWSLVGLLLFGGELPALRRVRAEAGRMAMALAMLENGGNISHAAMALGTSRRTLREGLKAVKLYPWNQRSDDLGGPPLGGLERPSPDVSEPDPCAPASVVDRPGDELDAIEDGTVGSVWFKHENGGVGSAFLVRGERRHRLFHGQWVREDVARAYADKHSHTFELWVEVSDGQ